MAESELLKLTGVGPKAAKTLEDCGYNTIEKIAKATAEELSQLPGIGLAIFGFDARVIRHHFRNSK